MNKMNKPLKPVPPYYSIEKPPTRRDLVIYAVCVVLYIAGGFGVSLLAARYIVGVSLF